MSREDYKHLEPQTHLEGITSNGLFDELYEINLGTRVYTVMELERRFKEGSQVIDDLITENSKKEKYIMKEKEAVNKVKAGIIDTIAEECLATAVKNGFWSDGPNDGEKIALMHSELSEMLEALRETDTDWDNVVEEAADCIIRIFDWCSMHELSIGDAIIKKMAINKERAYKHGKRF